jgi:hypothetical protein
MLYDDVCYDEYIVNLRVYVMQIYLSSLSSTTNNTSCSLTCVESVWQEKVSFIHKLKNGQLLRS